MVCVQGNSKAYPPRSLCHGRHVYLRGKGVWIMLPQEALAWDAQPCTRRGGGGAVNGVSTESLHHCLSLSCNRPSSCCYITMLPATWVSRALVGKTPLLLWLLCNCHHNPTKSSPPVLQVLKEIAMSLLLGSDKYGFECLQAEALEPRFHTSRHLPLGIPKHLPLDYGFHSGARCWKLCIVMLKLEVPKSFFGFCPLGLIQQPLKSMERFPDFIACFGSSFLDLSQSPLKSIASYRVQMTLNQNHCNCNLSYILPSSTKVVCFFKNTFKTFYFNCLFKKVF